MPRIMKINVALDGTPSCAEPASSSSSPATATAAKFFSPRSAAASVLSSFSSQTLAGQDDIAETTEEANAEASFLISNLSSSNSKNDLIPGATLDAVIKGSALALKTTTNHHHVGFQEPLEQGPSPTSYLATAGPPAAVYASNKPKPTHPADNSFVTPTPSKKPRSSMIPGMPMAGPGGNGHADAPPAAFAAASGHHDAALYDRKRKSLGTLAVIVTDYLGTQPAGTMILVDELAKQLFVERRRIYDVINILESVYMVVKHAKNTYVWLSSTYLPQMLAILQQEAITMLPMDAVQNGLLDANSDLLERSADASAIFASTSGEAKSLSRLSQQFLHVFLVGHEAVSLAEATEKIAGHTWTETELATLVNKGGVLPEDPKELTALASKGLKTKIRRLYDVGNVLTAIGVLTKLDERYWARHSNAATRPMYSWTYHLKARTLITDVHPNMPQCLKRFKAPHIDGAQLTMQILKMAGDPARNQHQEVQQEQQSTAMPTTEV